MSKIKRIGAGARMSKAVVHGDTVYTAGQVADRTKGGSVKEQTREILGLIDAILAETGGDKSKILSATIYLSDIATFAEMNGFGTNGSIKPIRPPAPPSKPSSSRPITRSRSPSSRRRNHRYRGDCSATTECRDHGRSESSRSACAGIDQQQPPHQTFAEADDLAQHFQRHHRAGRFPSARRARRPPRRAARFPAAAEPGKATITGVWAAHLGRFRMAAAWSARRRSPPNRRGHQRTLGVKTGVRHNVSQSRNYPSRRRRYRKRKQALAHCWRRAAAGASRRRHAD